MKKVLLLLAIVFGIAYGYHRYTDKLASASEAQAAPAPATPVVRRATPVPRHATSLQTHSLNGTGPNSTTPNPKVNPLNAPHR